MSSSSPCSASTYAGWREANPVSFQSVESTDPLMAPTLDLRKGAPVLYRSPVADIWQEGELVRGSPTGEEWLVQNRFGQYLVPLTPLRPAMGPQPGHRLLTLVDRRPPLRCPINRTKIQPLVRPN